MVHFSCDYRFHAAHRQKWEYRRRGVTPAYQRHSTKIGVLNKLAYK